MINTWLTVISLLILCTGNHSLEGVRCGLKHDLKDTDSLIKKGYFLVMVSSAVITLVALLTISVLLGLRLFNYDVTPKTRTVTMVKNNPDETKRETTDKEQNCMTSQNGFPSNNREYDSNFAVMYVIFAITSVTSYAASLASNVAADTDSDVFWSDVWSTNGRWLILFLNDVYMFGHVIKPIIYWCVVPSFRKDVCGFLKLSSENHRD